MGGVEGEGEGRGVIEEARRGEYLCGAHEIP